MNTFICDWKITIILVFKHFMFVVQFVFNDTYTVIKFKFGGLYSEIFFWVHNFDRSRSEFMYFD